MWTVRNETVSDEMSKEENSALPLGNKVKKCQMNSNLGIDLEHVPLQHSQLFQSHFLLLKFEQMNTSNSLIF